VGLLLALDTSSQMVGYALSDGEHLLAEAIWQGQRQGTATLLAEVMRALESLDRTQDDLTAVAVATGPGSFSGLRVGMGTAKGLALGLDLAIVGVPTLAFTAEPFRDFGRAVCALIPAGRGRYAYTISVARGRDWEPIAPVTHGTIAEIAAALRAYPGTIICGECDETAAEHFRNGAAAIVPSPGVRMRRPGALADVAWRRILAGKVDDLVALEPIYLHTSAAPSSGAP
jgi:tRNA threonylcarbamoyladenosine biosynthesis protein TsaB